MSKLLDIFKTGEIMTPDNKGINPLFKRHLAAYRFCIPFCQDREILEIGFGEGYGTNEIAEHARSVVGSDLQPELAEYAKDKYSGRGIEFLCASAESLPFKDETFDVIISLQVLEHVKIYQAMIKESYRVLRKGGKAIHITPNRLTMLSGVNPYHYREFDPDQLRNEMKAVFPRVKMMGLFGSERYLAIKNEEQRFARRLLRIDFLGLRRYLPRRLLAFPYRIAFKVINDNTDQLERKADALITVDDFYTSDGIDLGKALELIAIGEK